MRQVAFDDDPPKTFRLLVVEDEILIRMDMARHLRGAGYDVIEADSADEALRILMADTNVDLVVTDLRMPGTTDGMELIKWIRRRASTIKVIVVSAYVDPYWDLPVEAVLPKPVLIDRLLDCVRQLLPRSEQAGPCQR